jgi:hypothetical protein
VSGVDVFEVEEFGKDEEEEREQAYEQNKDI